jgi:hypothetical protein
LPCGLMFDGKQWLERVTVPLIVALCRGEMAFYYGLLWLVRLQCRVIQHALGRRVPMPYAR